MPRERLSRGDRASSHGQGPRPSGGDHPATSSTSAWRPPPGRDEYDRALAINVELRDRIAALLKESAEKDDVLGLISHEIRTPLAIIIGSAEALQAGRFDDEASYATTLDDIAVSARRVARMATNMLALVRQERERPPLEPLLLQRCLPVIRAEHLHLHPGAEIEMTLPPDLPPLLGVTGYIEQIVGNLLSNASKYGQPGEPITITAERVDDTVAVAVTTRGETMDPANIERLFLPFHREAEGRLLAPGLGLGLAVCRLLANAQDGSIFATAPPEGGLSVTFTLHVANE